MTPSTWRLLNYWDDYSKFQKNRSFTGCQSFLGPDPVLPYSECSGIYYQWGWQGHPGLLQLCFWPPKISSFAYILNNLSESSEDYIIVAEGDSCNRITSRAECERAAKQLNFPDPNGVHEASWMGLYAQGCICKEGGQDCLFNAQTTGLPCGTNDHNCICKKDSPNETRHPTTAERSWSVS